MKKVYCTLVLFYVADCTQLLSRLSWKSCEVDVLVLSLRVNPKKKKRKNQIHNFSWNFTNIYDCFDNSSPERVKNSKEIYSQIKRNFTSINLQRELESFDMKRLMELAYFYFACSPFLLVFSVILSFYLVISICFIYTFVPIEKRKRTALSIQTERCF